MMIGLIRDNSWWCEVVITVVYLLALFLCDTVKGQTPHEDLYGRRGDISYLPCIGCIAYKLILPAV
jgi:hypothetical protein